MHDEARIREEDGRIGVGVPTEMVDVQMREEHDVDVLGRDACLLEGARQEALVLGSPSLPQPGRPDARVEQKRLAAARSRWTGTRSRQAEPSKSSG